MTVLLIFACLIVLLLLIAVFCGLTDLHIHRKPNQGVIRVACAGDSITNGALIPGCFWNSYPSVRGKRLGKNYHVENFGLNGRTLSDQADRPYSAEAEARRCFDFQPDIVVLMLGTNDTKPKNWRGADDLSKRFDEMLAHFLDLSQQPRIILCTPPWAKNAENKLQGITNDTEAGLLPDVAACARKAAEKYGLELIDLYPLFEGKRELLSYDLIHPNIRGARLIAAEAAKKIRSAR